MPIKLAIFDVDGTLLRGDTACQWISRGLGNYDRMSEFEGFSTKEEIMAARREMAGWYSASTPEELMGDLEGFPWAPGTFEGIEQLQQAGITVALASLGWDFVIEKIASLFGITHTLGSEFDFGTGEFIPAWNEHKPEFAAKLSSELDIPVSEIAGIGDRPNDFKLLEFAGQGIYVGSEAPPPEKNFIHLPNADIRDVAAAIIATG